MLAPEARAWFAGVERCDSLVVDPHKWLYAPFDCCALLYRDPADGRLAHTQHAEYLDTLTDTDEFSPSDYSIQLTRRPRGLPLWFSLATYGVDAYRTAVSETLARSRRSRTRSPRVPSCASCATPSSRWSCSSARAGSAPTTTAGRTSCCSRSAPGRAEFARRTGQHALRDPEPADDVRGSRRILDTMR
jgi:glutamate/tyrosine decarboxylase-like PLP-dependent enzyme